MPPTTCDKCICKHANCMGSMPALPTMHVPLLLPPLCATTASATCNKPFEPNAPAEACFKDKEACWKRHAKGLLTGPEKEALGMLQYPPKTDRWGRQAFDYADDVSWVCWQHAV